MLPGSPGPSRDLYLHQEDLVLSGMAHLRFLELIWIFCTGLSQVGALSNDCQLLGDLEEYPVSQICAGGTGLGRSVLVDMYDTNELGVNTCGCQARINSPSGTTSLSISNFKDLGPVFGCGSYVEVHRAYGETITAQCNYVAESMTVEHGDVITIKLFRQPQSDSRYCLSLTLENSLSTVNVTCTNDIQTTTTTTVTTPTTTPTFTTKPQNSISEQHTTIQRTTQQPTTSQPTTTESNSKQTTTNQTTKQQTTTSSTTRQATTTPATTKQTTTPATTKQTTTPATTKQTTTPATTKQTTTPATTKQTTTPATTKQPTTPATTKQTTAPANTRQTTAPANTRQTTTPVITRQTTTPATTKQTTTPATTKQTTTPATTKQTTTPATIKQTTTPANTRQTTTPATTKQTTTPATTKQTTTPATTKQTVQSSTPQDIVMASFSSTKLTSPSVTTSGTSIGEDATEKVNTSSDNLNIIIPTVVGGFVLFVVILVIRLCWRREKRTYRGMGTLSNPMYSQFTNRKSHFDRSLHNDEDMKEIVPGDYSAFPTSPPSWQTYPGDTVTVYPVSFKGNTCDNPLFDDTTDSEIGSSEESTAAEVIDKYASGSSSTKKAGVSNVDLEAPVYAVVNKGPRDNKMTYIQV